MDRRRWIALALLALAGCTAEPPLVCRSATFGSGPVATWPDTLRIEPEPSDTAATGLRAHPDLFRGTGAAPLAVMLFHRPIAMHYRICQNTTRDGRETTQCMTRVPDTELLLVADFPRVPAFEQDSLFARTDRAANAVGEGMARCREASAAKARAP